MRNLSIPPLVVSPGQTIQLSQLGTISASASNPTYLVLNGYDRNEYTVASSGTTGSFSGNAHTLGFSAIGGDARGAGIVFTYNAVSGRYFSSTYGYLDQLSYTASTSTADITDLSLFGTNSASIANSYASSAIALAQTDASGYLGTLTVATEPGYSSTVPTQATPFSIAAIAQSFVGSAWNTNGCWTLTSTIAAEAGASLPVQSAVNMAGAANGEWFVAYNGPAGSSGNWASSVQTGDMIGFVTASGTGHITTCVSGSGSTAMLVDNITYWNAQGSIINSANDGSANDIIISAAHAASQEFAGVSASSVVIYRLDTPVVATLTATLNVSVSGTANLADVFAATDPAGNAITTYQAYTTSSSDWFTVDGTSSTATSAASAVTASSLSDIIFDRGAVAVTDTVTVRAYNGTYWGDWTTISTAGSSSMAMSNPLTAATGDEVSIYRFFDVADGTHFYTASTSERDSLVATRSDMTFEGTAFYEDATPQAGDTAVYRFFETTHGTHLFTQSASEQASILATRPDLVSEGIAFYAPS